MQTVRKITIHGLCSYVSGLKEIVQQADVISFRVLFGDMPQVQQLLAVLEQGVPGIRDWSLSDACMSLID